MPLPDLREVDLERLNRVFRRFSGVRRVLLFGSRATGSAKRVSDVDLAVEAPAMSDLEWGEFHAALDDAPIILELDVIRLDRLPAGSLAEAIRREGIPVYTAAGER
ncbi:MAG: nucleotidyltransferase domain-containing protein [Lentisphaeria bacterium]